MPQHFPEFFRGMRRERSKQADEIFRAESLERFVLFGKRVVFYNRIHVFHQSRDGRIERKRFEIFRNAFYRIITGVVQLFFRRAERNGFFRRLELHRFFHETFHAFHETGDRFDSVVVPGAAFRIRKAEHKIKAEYVGSIFFHVFIGGNDVALRFGHAVAVRP